MKQAFSHYVKFALSSVAVLTAASLCTWRLMDIQIVNREAFIPVHVNTVSYEQTIEATRGEIVDSMGNPIIENKTGYNVILEPDIFPEDYAAGNDILLRLAEFLTQNGIELKTAFPIERTNQPAEPYQFSDDKEAAEKIRSDLHLNVYATAENCLDKLYDDYDIGEHYTEAQRFLLAALRYEMQIRSFSMSTAFTVVQDIPKTVATNLKERGVTFRGVNIVEVGIRRIAQGDVLPHEIGTVGPIYAEEYDELKEKGYDLDDSVGKSGIEKAMEDTLRGKDGTKKITMENGEIVGSSITRPVQAGSTIQLTVNSDYQRELQKILQDFIANWGSLRGTSSTALGDVSCGAIVVLDAKTGGVLGMATAPTFDLNNYKTDYEDLLQADNNPLFNRATNGTYRPGSTFKTITATAGLNEGIIDGYSTYDCSHIYNFHGHEYQCTGTHGYISVAPALRVSCNIFFYKLSEQLTIDRITSYAQKFGLGQSTGIEIDDNPGHMSNPESFAALNTEWTVGQVLQSAIGQGEWAVTPLQMANVACTLANRGERLTPHLVDSIWDYNHTEKQEQIGRNVADRIVPLNDSVFDFVESGMIGASTNGFPDKYSISNLGYDVAIKTGTPQVSGRVQDSFFIGYAPVGDPEIAFAGVIEGGEYSKYMIRSIIQGYEKFVKKTPGAEVENYGVTVQTTTPPAQTTAPPAQEQPAPVQ